MRTIITAILMSLAVAGEVAAMEALWGRVVSIDRKGREMVVQARMMAAGPVESHGDGDAPPGRELTVHFHDTELPHCVAEGTVVRLWGDYSEENPDVFNAALIRGSGRRSWQLDPTGVRRRLGTDRRARGKGPHPVLKHGERSCVRTEVQ